jgi:hypothetical protein
VDDEWSAAMEQPTNPPPEHQTAEALEPQTCCDCGFITHQPIKVGEAWAAAGAGRTVYACPDHAPRYPVGGGS